MLVFDAVSTIVVAAFVAVVLTFNYSRARGKHNNRFHIGCLSCLWSSMRRQSMPAKNAANEVPAALAKKVKNINKNTNKRINKRTPNNQHSDRSAAPSKTAHRQTPARYKKKKSERVTDIFVKTSHGASERTNAPRPAFIGVEDYPAIPPEFC